MITPKLQAIRKRSQIAARLNIEAYSDSQGRDSSGKWSAGGSAKASTAADEATSVAHNMTGTHKDRAAAHRSAAALHNTASKAYASRGDKEKANYHRGISKSHRSAARRDTAMHHLGQAARTAGHAGLAVLNEIAKRVSML
jgi:hypothetical protein